MKTNWKLLFAAVYFSGVLSAHADEIAPRFRVLPNGEVVLSNEVRDDTGSAVATADAVRYNAAGDAKGSVPATNTLFLGAPTAFFTTPTSWAGLLQNTINIDATCISAAGPSVWMFAQLDIIYIDGGGNQVVFESNGFSTPGGNHVYPFDTNQIPAGSAMNLSWECYEAGNPENSLKILAAPGWYDHY